MNVIEAEDLTKVYRRYIKPEGIKGSLKGLFRREYEEKAAVSHVDLCVEEGEFVGIMGASGSGKTTLLNCVSTIDRVTSGKIIVNDIDVTRLEGNHLNQFRREELVLFPGFQPSGYIDRL